MCMYHVAYHVASHLYCLVFDMLVCTVYCESNSVELQINLFFYYYYYYYYIITTRLDKKLDENQPREQAGFRSKYYTTDHIQLYMP